MVSDCGRFALQVSLLEHDMVIAKAVAFVEDGASLDDGLALNGGCPR